jgi:DNA repair exonuclease SbcCD ATPase subunit
MDYSQPLDVATSYDYYRIQTLLRQKKEDITERIGARNQLVKDRDAATERIAKAKVSIGNFDKVLWLLQEASAYSRQEVKGQVEGIAAEALGVTYPGDHKFEIDLQVRSGRPEVDYYLFSDGVRTQLKKPDYGRGGGKLDVICLALRFAVIERQQVPGPIFLDEVGKHVSKEAAPHLAYFIAEYAKQFDRQIILNTHNEDLAGIGDVSYRMYRPDDTKGSQVVRIGTN